MVGSSTVILRAMASAMATAFSVFYGYFKTFVFDRVRPKKGVQYLKQPPLKAVHGK